MFHSRAALAAAVLVTAVLAAPMAEAVTTFDLTGAGGNIGKQAVFGPVDGVSLEVTAINTEEPAPPVLLQNGNGLGVFTTCGIFTGEGSCLNPEAYQLNNIGDDEAIIFDFGRQIGFVSMTLTETAIFEDSYSIYGTNTDLEGVTSGGLSALTAFSTLIASGSTSADPFDVALSGAYRYLIATVPGGSGDGYRVSSITVTPVPLGAPLIASAFGIAWLIRRRAA
jgi:hypothetical protein